MRPFLDDQLYSFGPYIFYCGQTKADFAILHLKTHAATVYIRRQHLYAFLSAVGNILCDFFRALQTTVHQRGHGFHRIMRFQPRCPIGYDAIGRRMGFVEGILRKIRHLVKNLAGHLFRHAVFHCARHCTVLRTIDKRLPFFGHYIAFFLAHSTPNQVATRPAISRQLTDDLHNLLLIHHAAVSYL